MAGMMGMAGKGKGAAAEPVEAETEAEPTFDDAFDGLCKAMGVSPKDKAEAAAAFRACCAMAEE